MNSSIFQRYHGDYCGEVNVVKYDDGQIQRLTEARGRHIWKILLELSNTISSEKLNGHLVDVGCGFGHTTVLFAEHFERLTGVDVSLEQIRQAREIYTNDNVEFLVGRAENLPVESSSADAITAVFSAHFVDINAFVSECLRVLKPGGVAVFYGDNWIRITPADDTAAKKPDATYLMQNLNRDLREIARKQLHPQFYLLDLHESLFKEINVTEKKSRPSGRLEIVMSLAEKLNYEMGVPFNQRMGAANPFYSFSKKLKELWKMEDVPNEELMLRVTNETFPIVIKK